MKPEPPSSMLGLRERLTKVFAVQPAVPRLLLEEPADSVEKAGWLARKEQNEAQGRVLRVDRVLGALGWRIADGGGATNVAVEVSVRPGGSRYKRRLDYFGYDSGDRRPLLVVETKTPSLGLPVTDGHATPTSHPLGGLIREWASGRQNPKTRLNQDWEESLAQLRDYVVDVQERQGGLTRAVLTNGDWWVVILDPVTALKPGPDGAPTDLVRVYESPKRVLDLAEELGSLLLYTKVAGSAEPVFVDQILFCIDPTLIVGMSFGVRVLHVVDVKSWDLQVPRVEVAPVLFLHAQGGGRLAVVGDSADAVLPGARPTKLRQHLKAVERSARRLRREVERILALRLPAPRPISEAYSAVNFALWPAVVERRIVPGQHHVRRFIIETGQHTHFIVDSARYAGCPGHRFADLAPKRRNALGFAVSAPSIEEMTVLTDDSPFHCADNAVRRVKAGNVTPDNRERCGPRSTAVFCEIAGFEHHLCCRTCAFELACAKAKCFAGAGRRCVSVPLTVGAKSRRGR